MATQGAPQGDAITFQKETDAKNAASLKQLAAGETEKPKKFFEIGEDHADFEVHAIDGKIVITDAEKDDQEALAKKVPTKAIHSFLKDKTLVVYQPGSSYPGRWDGEKGAADMACWKELDGAAGCGSQLDKLIALGNEYQDLKINVLVVVSPKTADQLKAVINSKKLPENFNVVALTENSIKAMKGLGFPFIQFQGGEFPKRFSFYCESKNIKQRVDASEMKPADVTNEPQQTFVAIKKLQSTKKLQAS